MTHVNVPIRIKVIGHLGTEDLDRLEAAVSRAIANQLRQLPGTPGLTDPELVREEAPARLDDEWEIPSYQGPPGATARLPVLGPEPEQVLPRENADKFDRWAAEQEAAEHLVRQFDAMRRRGKEGLAVDEEVDRRAVSVAHKAESDAQLRVLAGRVLRDPSIVIDEQAAERFVEMAVHEYGKRHGYSADLMHALVLSMLQEHRDEQIAARRWRVAEIVEWIPTDRAARLAAEFGMDYDFVAEYLEMYDRMHWEEGMQQGYTEMARAFADLQHSNRSPIPKFAPGLLHQPEPDPDDPFLLLAELALGFVPGVGLIEGITGKSILMGEPLSFWERALGIASDLIPIAGKALRPLGAAVRVGVRGVRAAARGGARAVDWAVTALRLNLPPEAMLRHMSRIHGLNPNDIERLRARIRDAQRAGTTAVNLTDEEVRLLKDADEAFGELTGGRRTGTGPDPTTGGPKPAERAGTGDIVPPGETAQTFRDRFTPEEIARIEASHPALVKFLRRFDKIALDDESLAQLRKLFLDTRASRGTYQRVRSGSGGLMALVQLDKADSTALVRLLNPVDGMRMPDFQVVTRSGEIYYVEVTMPTLSRKLQRGPARAEPGGAGHLEPHPGGTTRPATSSDIKEAFNRKLRTPAQISETRPGVVIVELLDVPAGKPALTAGEIAELDAAVSGKSYVKELLISVPGPGGRRLLRVGTKDSGLGLAQGTLDAQ
jgi:hypothetical protein